MCVPAKNGLGVGRTIDSPGVEIVYGKHLQIRLWLSSPLYLIIKRCDGRRRSELTRRHARLASPCKKVLTHNLSAESKHVTLKSLYVLPT